jgi:membrane protease YdiL (CAAX protease family)
VNAVARVFAAALGPVLIAAVALGVPYLLRGRVPSVLGVLLTAALALAVYCLHTRYLERREPVELAGRSSPWLAGGALLGIALIAGVMGSLGIVGTYRLQGFAPFPVDVAAGAGVALGGAVIEELLFRGYVFRWCARWNVWAAVALTSLLFGFAHAANPHATPFSSAAIAVEAGLLLSAAYWLSGNLWFPIGVHMGWNFAEGTLFSTPVSGAQTPGLLLGTLSGPPLLTGGGFGVEASLAAVLVCTAAGVGMLALCVERRAQPVR